MDEVLPLLWRLQELDRIQAKRLKERSVSREPSSREQLLASVEEAAKAEQESAKRLAQARSAFRQLELDLGAVEEYLANNEARLYGGYVTNPKEITQLEQRVDEERARRSKLETEYLRCLEEVEDCGRSLAAARQTLASARLALGESERELAMRQELEAKEDDEYRVLREEILSQLPEAYRVKYERIHANHPGSALVRIDRGSCSGCHNALSQAEIERVARLPGLTTCENCGRLLDISLPEAGGNG